VLANRLPDYLKTRFTDLHLPPQALGQLPSGGANSIFQPGVLSHLPGPVASAIRYALSDTLHDIYLFAGAVLVVALISTVFMKEVPLTSGAQNAGFGEAPPVDEDVRGEREPVPA